jgi:hypothetical protein
MYPPNDPAHVSFSLIERQGGAVSCPVFKVTTIMSMLGHRQIDLLKLDIEGAEYDVIENIVSEKVRIGQLCVEFHHRWREIGSRRTDLAIDRLRSFGYRLFHVSPSGEEFSFLNTQIQGL